MAWLLCLPVGQASSLASSYRSTLFLAHRPKAGLSARDQRFESVSLQRGVTCEPRRPGARSAGALPAGMLSRRIDASAKIASPAGGDASANRLFCRFALAVGGDKLAVPVSKKATTVVANHSDDLK